MAGMANNTTTYYAVYFLIAATFIIKGSHNGQETRNSIFFIFRTFQNLTGID